MPACHLNLSPLSVPPPSVHIFGRCVHMWCVPTCGCARFVYLRPKENVRISICPCLIFEAGSSLNLKLAGSARLAGQQTPRIHLSLPPNNGMASPGGHAWLLSLLTQIHLSSLASMTVRSLPFLLFSFFNPLFAKDLDYLPSTCGVQEMITANAMYQACSKIPCRSLERMSQVVCL